jgi:hypothetical protein
MVADWLGAQRSKHGDWNIEKRFKQDLPYMRLHSTTRVRLRSAMELVRRIEWK